MAEQNKIPESVKHDWAEITKRAGIDGIKPGDIQKIMEGVLKYNGLANFTDHIERLTNGNLSKADIGKLLKAMQDYYEMNSLAPYAAYIKAQYSVELSSGEVKDVIGEAVNSYSDKEQKKQEASKPQDTVEKEINSDEDLLNLDPERMQRKQGRINNSAGAKIETRQSAAAQGDFNFDGITRTDIDLKEYELKANEAKANIMAMIKREKKKGTLSQPDEQRYLGIIDEISNMFAAATRNVWLREEGDKIMYQIRRLKDLDILLRNAKERQGDKTQ